MSWLAGMSCIQSLCVWNTVLIWAAYLILLVPVVGWIYGHCKNGPVLAAAALLLLGAAADEVATLSTGWTSPAALSLAIDFAPFLWLVTREDRRSRLFSLTYAGSIALHWQQIAAPIDPWRYWLVWAALDFAQLGVLIWWARRQCREETEPLPAPL